MVPGFDWLDAYAYKPINRTPIYTSAEAAQCIQHVCQEHNVHCRVMDTRTLVIVNLETDGTVDYVKHIYDEVVKDPIWEELRVEVNAPSAIHLPGDHQDKLYRRIMRALPTYTFEDTQTSPNEIRCADPEQGLMTTSSDEPIDNEFSRQYAYGLIECEKAIATGHTEEALKNMLVPNTPFYNDMFPNG